STRGQVMYKRPRSNATRKSALRPPILLGAVFSYGELVVDRLQARESSQGVQRHSGCSAERAQLGRRWFAYNHRVASRPVHSDRQVGDKPAIAVQGRKQ